MLPCDDPEGVGWGRRGRQAREGGDRCTETAESHCTEANNTALESLDPPVENKC